MADRKVLKALISIAGEIDPSLQKTLKRASSSFSGIGKAAKITGAVTAAGMATAAAATVKAVEAAASYESSFAKTATLLTGTQGELQEYSQAILSMSNDTGIAAGELTETVYSAISAGIDQEDAVEFAGQAAKLAAGGFTDSATAVDVMTTALNAYGLEADQAGQISDYLITTQNLGKTTVDELASSVGKVIPIASAYGVEMDNLSAAYAQLTAGGIATAEAGTYLKGMLNELGDSGSTVSAVLQEQTGMGFAELTESGKSLGDIMQILGDSVGGDAGAFNELWSSSEAGVGALSLLNGGSAAYNETLDAMRNSTGATDAAYGTMTGTLEHQIEVIKNLGQNFLISLGQQVLPYVSELAEKAIPLITGAMDGLMDTAGPILKEIAGTLFPMLVGAVGECGTIFQQIAPFIQEAMSQLLSVIQQLLPVVMQMVQDVLPIILDVLAQLMPIFMEIISSVLPVIQQLITALMPPIATLFQALSPIISLIGQVVSELLPPLMSYISSLTPIISTVANIISTVLTVAIQALLPIFEGIISAVGGIADIFSTVFGGLVGVVSKPVNAIIGLVNSAIKAINGISVDVPDWVPVMGGKHLGFSIPTIPAFAAGGFTDGVSIAGEKGTEAVISFDPAYRSENLSYWAKAGQMLGASDSDLLSLIEDAGGYSGGSTQEINLGGVTFAPNITIQGSATKEDVIGAIREAEPEFFDLLEEFIRYRGNDSYEPAY